MSTTLRNYLGHTKARLVTKAKKISAGISSLVHPGLTALLYHRVTHLSHDPQFLSVTPELFEAHVRFLKKTNRLMTVDQFEKISDAGGRFPAKSVLITFDDGYADNYNEALPIMERLGVQALFFISTATIDTEKEFWWDNLERIFLQNAMTPNRLRLQIGNKTEDMPTGTELEKVLAYRTLNKILKPMAAQEREHAIQEMLTWAKLPEGGRKTHRSMTNEEVKKLSESPSARIGAHTHHHVSLGSLSTEEQRVEIMESKHILESIAGKTASYFSYPFGGTGDYSGNTERLCEQAGFKAAFTNSPGLIRTSTNRFRLPRVIVRNWELAKFVKNI